jgi:hypothetical protein
MSIAHNAFSYCTPTPSAQYIFNVPVPNTYLNVTGIDYSQRAVRQAQLCSPPGLLPMEKTKAGEIGLRITKYRVCPCRGQGERPHPRPIQERCPAAPAAEQKGKYGLKRGPGPGPG